MTIILLAIGLLIGAVLGLTGAGGSVLAMPLLLIFLNINASSATGLALGVVAISSLYGSLHHILHRNILWIPAALFGVSGAFFAPLGRIAANHVPSAVLVISFSMLSFIIAIRMLWQSIKQPEAATVVRASTEQTSIEPLLCKLSETQKFDWRFRCVTGLTLGGICTGLLSGFFGVGGGFLIVPFLTLLNGVSMRNAVATSLLIIAAISSSGFMAHLAMQAIDWHQLLLLSIGGIAGMALGGLLAKKIAGVQLQRIFAITIIVMACVIYFN